MIEIILVHLLIAVVVQFTFRMFREPHPPPAQVNQRYFPHLGAVEFGTRVVAPTVPIKEDATPLGETLRRICRASGYASTAIFLEGAKRAYELVTDAFANGHIDEYRHLLTDAVRDAFETAIADRRARGESVTLTFIGLRAAEIVDAGMEDGTASIDVRFVAELVSVTRDRDGVVVAGHPERVVEAPGVWTFARELRSASPDWLLAGTDSDE